jgi:hypothetical protein
MANKESSKHTPHSRGVRFSSNVYRTAEALEAVAGNDDTPDGIHAALMDAMFEFSVSSGITVAHPALISLAFKLMVERIAEVGDDRKDEMRRDFERIKQLVRCCSFTDEDGSIKTLYAGLELLQQRAVQHDALEDASPDDDDDDDDDDMPGDEPRLAPVVDLLCWRQSHPRPIRKLLFAERAESGVR